MIRFLACTILILVLVGAFLGQQATQSAPWNVTMEAGKVADSTLTVVNRCKNNHQFQIQTQNVPFLQVSANQANVKGGKTQVIPVKFDTRNLAPGVYQGQVLVICLSCKSEGTCTQDREVLQVNLTVTAAPPGTGQPAGPGQPPATTQPPSNQAAAQGPGVTANLSLDLANLRGAEAAAQEAADRARQAAETAEQDARNAKAQADAAQKAKDDALKAVNDANKAVAEAEKARDEVKNPTTKEHAELQAAIDKANADLAAKQKALKDAQAAIATGKTKAAADKAAKEAAAKKAEADKAAAALAKAQAAVAEKEKEILKAQPKAASTTPKTDPPPPKPTPCKNGAIRYLGKPETKEFVYADDASVIEFTSSATSEGAISAALSMAALWRAGAQIGGLATEGLAAPKGSTHGVGFVLNYLSTGADILEKLAESRISGLNAGVTAEVAITTKKVTVTCTTFEVCVYKVWVRKAVLDKVVGAGPVRKKTKDARYGQPGRKDVEAKGSPQFLDADKVDKWLRDFLAGELDKLRLEEKKYADFVKNCK